MMTGSARRSSVDPIASRRRVGSRSPAVRIVGSTIEGEPDSPTEQRASPRAGPSRRGVPGRARSATRSQRIVALRSTQWWRPSHPAHGGRADRSRDAACPCGARALCTTPMPRRRSARRQATASPNPNRSRRGRRPAPVVAVTGEPGRPAGGPLSDRPAHDGDCLLRLTVVPRLLCALPRRSATSRTLSRKDLERGSSALDRQPATAFDRRPDTRRRATVSRNPRGRARDTSRRATTGPLHEGDCLGQQPPQPVAHPSERAARGGRLVPRVIPLRDGSCAP